MTTIPLDHPLRKASWIWPQTYMYLYNHFAHFRKDFDLARLPVNAPLFITADKAYKLWVNGTYVCRGPARGYQSHWPFDEVDIASMLRQGHNWISVEAYNPGISTFQYLHQTSAGFLCAAAWDGFSFVSDRKWQMRRSPAQTRETARYSLQIDFQEHIDFRLDDRTWITDEKPPANWRAEIFPEGGQQFLESPFGRPPYTSVEPRGIPLMRETVVAPERIAAHITVPCGENYRTWKNVSWPFVREVWEKQWDNGAAVKGKNIGDSFEVVIEPSGEGKMRAVTLAMPKYVVGNVILDVNGASGGEIVDLNFHERMNGERPSLNLPGCGCSAAMANRLRCAAGETKHEFFHHLGFSAITIVVRDAPSALTVRLAVRGVGYPFTMRGAFECSERTLNDIHAISRHTQQICSLDAYVDTPWREQAQWWGDARVQAKNTFYLDGDARLLARGIRSIAGQSTPEGLTYGHAPTSAHNCILPDFALTWILTIWDHYWQTGDISLFVEQLPRIEKVLGYFDTPEARHVSGLLRYDRRLWLFEDWSTLYKGEIPTFLNLWYLFTMRTLAQMAALARKGAEAKRYRAIAEKHQRLVLSHLYDPSAKLFCGGLDEKLKKVKEISVHDQTLALMMDLTPEAHETMIRTRLMPFLKEEPLDGPIPSAFWVTYTFEEMVKRGYGREVIDFIRKKWSPMLVSGTTWEGYGWSDGKAGGTVSHAWTAHPSFHLVNILAGVSQTGPAWTSVRVAPQFVDGIDNARALIPSPKGDICASWKRTGNAAEFSLSIPAGVTANVELPGVKKTVRGPAEYRENVELK
ncbi:MAG: alpha-L-rhamnosidase C-terminal domain-containing protein [Spirochaetota bacterium]